MRATLRTACMPPMSVPCSRSEVRFEAMLVTLGIASPAPSARRPTTG